jgi:hypothetical protein
VTPLLHVKKTQAIGAAIVACQFLIAPFSRCDEARRAKNQDTMERGSTQAVKCTEWKYRLEVMLGAQRVWLSPVDDLIRWFSGRVRRKFSHGSMEAQDRDQVKGIRNFVGSVEKENKRDIEHKCNNHARSCATDTMTRRHHEALYPRLHIIPPKAPYSCVPTPDATNTSPLAPQTVLLRTQDKTKLPGARLSRPKA